MIPERRILAHNRENAMEQSKALLKDEISTLKAYCHGEPFCSTLIINLLSERISKRSFRVHFLQSMYAYVQDMAALEGIKLDSRYDDHFFYVRLPFAVEGIVSVLYHQNFIFDGKQGVKSASNIRHHVLAGNLLERAIYSYVQGEFADGIRIQNALQNVLVHTDIGQHLESRLNGYEQFCKEQFRMPKDIREALEDLLKSECFNEAYVLLKKQVPADKHEFLRCYLLRISHTSATLFVQLTSLICDLSGYDGLERENLMKYAYYTGILLQLVNDCIDFIPSEYNRNNIANKRADCFSDLRNKNITLPLIHCLTDEQTKKNGSIEHLLHADFNGLSSQQEYDLFVEIAEFIQHKTLKDCENMAELACRHLHDSEYSNRLAEKTEIAYDNLFTRTLLKLDKIN